MALFEGYGPKPRLLLFTQPRALPENFTTVENDPEPTREVIG